MSVPAWKDSKNLAAVLDSTLATAKPSSIVFGTIGAVIAAYTAANLLEKGKILKRLDQSKWRWIRYFLDRVYIQYQIADATKGIVMKKDEKDIDVFTLPAEGLSQEEVLKHCVARRDMLDHNYKEGGCSGTVYHGGDKHTELVNKSMEVFTWANPLHVDVFGAVRKMEAEIVSMCVDMYNGSKTGACGGVTSGGSESIAMALKSTREWARFEKGYTTFSMVAPQTIHPAFDKACNFFGIDLIKIPMPADGTTGIVDPAEYDKYIRHDTILFAASAPCFPNGTIDRIPEIAKKAKAYGICMHVDACLGGFIVPFLDAAGFTEHPKFDFSVDGITSISCDTHKYGAAPKGTSVVLYHNKALRRYQFFTCAEWPGGNYASPAAAGSKAGNVIAGTWAAMMSIGRNGYVENCRKIVSTNVKIVAGLKKIDSIFVIGSPNASVLGFGSKKIDVFELNAKLQKKGGWMLNPLQFPSGLQFSLTLLQANEETSDRFLADVKQCTEELLADLKPGEVKDSSAGASLYGSQQRVADRSIISEVLKGFCDKYYTI